MKTNIYDRFVVDVGNETYIVLEPEEDSFFSLTRFLRKLNHNDGSFLLIKREHQRKENGGYYNAFDEIIININHITCVKLGVGQTTIYQDGDGKFIRNPSDLDE